MQPNKSSRLSLLLYAKILQQAGISMHVIGKCFYWCQRGLLWLAFWSIRWSVYCAAHATNLLAESVATYEEIERLDGGIRPNLRKEGAE